VQEEEVEKVVHDRLRGSPVDVQKRKTRLGRKVGQGLGRVTIDQIAWRRVLWAMRRYVDLESDLLKPCTLMSATYTESVHSTQDQRRTHRERWPSAHAAATTSP
jgi:hypothetical protein